MVAAVLTIGLKLGAWWITNSVGLLSDAAESLINLLTASVAVISLWMAARPPDAEHEFGHGKIEYFAAGFQGGMILIAAGGIITAALDRFLHPQALAQLTEGLVFAAVASLVNAVVAVHLRKVGKEHGSVALVGEAEHLLTDVWTTVGVLVGLGAVRFTGWHWLDPALASAVALNITFTGVRLVREAALGLLDTTLPDDEQQAVREVLDRYCDEESMEYHALRTRRAGMSRFVSVHVLVPGDWSVRRGHSLLERLEADIRGVVQGCAVFTHLEPVEEPASFEDQELQRASPEAPAPPPGGLRPPRS